MRFWGLDLVAELGTPRLTWRRLGVLIARIPEDSALARSLAGPEAALWTPERHLLAGAIDSLGVVAYLVGGLLVGLGSVKENPVPQPKPIQRPGVAVEQPAPAGNRGLMSLAKKMGQPVPDK